MDAPEMESLLARAGIATVPDRTAGSSGNQPVTAVSGAVVLTVTEWQAQNMAGETSSHGGITGFDLDTTFPLGTGAPPVAFVVAAWATVGADEAAQSAARLLGSQDWTHAESAVFPDSVLQLFVADLLRHVQHAPSSSSASPARYLVAEPVSGPPTGSCTGMASFVDGVLSDIFDALKLDPVEVGQWISGTLGDGVIGTVAGVIGGFLAGFWNKAVEFAEHTVRGVLAAITAPLLNTLRTVIGALETITTVVSYLHRWTAPITPDPDSNSFWTAGQAAHRGSFTLTVNRQDETSDWPALLTDCAQALGKPAPTLSREGMPVAWGIVQQESGLATVDRPATANLVGTLNADLSDRLDYTTGSETAQVAASPLVDLPTITVTAHVRRTEIDELSDLLIGYLAANFPPIVQPTIRAVLGYFFGWAKSKLDQLTAVDGSATIVISHHLPDADTPTATSSPTPTPTQGTATAPSARPQVNVCALLSAADASGPGGVTYGAATPRHLADGWDQCVYTNVGHSDPVDIYPMQVDVLSLSDCLAMLQSVHQQANGDTTAVPGVGDAAFGYRIGLVAQAGSRCVQVQGMTHAELDGDYGHDIALATTVLSRSG